VARSTNPVDRLERWQESGLIDAAQRAAIEAWENEHGLDAAGPSPWRRRIVVVVGFVGIVLAVAAASIILSEYWDSLTGWARLALVALITGVLLAAGESARRSGSGARRIASFSWVLGVGGMAWLAGLLLDGGDASTEVMALGISFTAMIVAAVLWHRLPSPLQMFALAAALQFFAVSVVGLQQHADELAYGPVIWLVGVLTALGAWSSTTKPIRSAWLTGVLGIAVGASVLAIAVPTLGITIGLASSAAVLWVSVTDREPLLLWLGTLGMLEFVPWAIVHFLGIDSLDVGGGSDVFLVLGMLVLGLFVLGWSRREARRWRTNDPLDVVDPAHVADNLAGGSS